MFRIGIDVGGTFTDLVAVDQSGRVTLAKSTSTPKDPSIGVMDGLGLLAAELGLDLAGLLGQTDLVVHGTTVATNALLERKGATVGMLTTEGHRDIIEMREGLKDDRYNLRMPPPRPLVPRARRLDVRERMRFDGRVEVPLGRRSLDAAIRRLRGAGVNAVAVCYLHSYRDPRHEQATLKALRRRLPEAYVSLSSEVLPQIKEYERFCTTVVNAYVGPALGHYLQSLAERLRAAGYAGEVLIMQSHGGVATIADSVRLAAGAVLSGPAGGIAGGRHAARLLGEGNLITFDMGGTSTDIALIEGGEPQLTGDKSVAGQKVAMPAIDIHTLGAGGGSVARVDAGGILYVGPESAGADPGPACYGRGGRAATVTDANVVLGLLDPANFLGGRQRLDAAAAKRAVERIARKLGIPAVAAAEGIHRVVNTNMAEGIRIVSVRRGADPRRFALLSFGGAAGLHITEVARMLEISRVVVPRVASVLSAWGMLATDLRYELVRTHVGEAQHVGGARLRRLFAEMEAEGRRRMAKAFGGPVSVRRGVDMRYGEQTFEITVSLDGVDVDSPGLIDEVVARFHRRHEELYTYSAPGQEAVLVNARLAVVGELPTLPAEQSREATAASPAPRSRRVYLERWLEVPVHNLEGLRAGDEVKGPTIFESPTTTVVIRQGERAVVTPHGWLDIRLT
ncbi:MAG TPA: hydantoinase/oxoprolinase family protein [Methylomirabilota bacterium]|jgi:N-methylhydantoinase A|nr:hydantoinase/oxoprolinase family protein [Methylomirabilota bacterium]